MFLAQFVPNSLQYHSEFPHNFFAKSWIGTFVMFRGCDRTVTNPPIMVFRAGTLRSHPVCPGPVYPQWTPSVHRQVIQGVPGHKPNTFSPGLIQDVLG